MAKQQRLTTITYNNKNHNKNTEYCLNILSSIVSPHWGPAYPQGLNILNKHHNQNTQSFCYINFMKTLKDFVAINK
jgi:hypothetical protein